MFADLAGPEPGAAQSSPIRGEVDAPAPGLVDDGVLLVLDGELGGGVQPGGDAARRCLRECVGERGDEQVRW